MLYNTKIDHIIQKCTNDKHKNLILDNYMLSRIVKKTDVQYALYNHNILQLIELHDKEKPQYVRDCFCLMFLPLILKKSVYLYDKFFKKYYPRLLISDLIQEAHLIFLELVDRYDKNISTFPYFMKEMLYRPLHNYALKNVEYVRMTPVSMVPNSQAKDPIYNSEHSFVVRVFSDIVCNDYANLIKAVKLKKSRSVKTVDNICDNIFLGTKSVADVAKNLNVTYHSVYQVHNRLRKEIGEMINKNKFSNYFIDIEQIKSKTDRVVQYRFDVCKKNNLKEKVI